jgi:RNA methyltransferase, TrmH family
MIESVNNKKIKEYAKLHLKKERDKQRLFIIEGKHMIEEALKAKSLYALYLLDGVDNPFDFECEHATQEVLNKLSNQTSNAKMIGVCKKLNYIQANEKHIILLDTVQDPGNVGTIIRSAYSFGYDCVYLSKGCADIYNPKTIQASQGALFHIPCIQTELKDKIESLDMETYATALNNKHINLQDAHPKDEYAILLGNEGEGIHPELIDLCDYTVKIEMDTFESLNVAIAASICMYTFKHKD